MNSRGCDFFEWIHERAGSSSSNIQTPIVDTLATRSTESIVRHMVEMELHASDRVSEFCCGLLERLNQMNLSEVSEKGHLEN